MFYLLGKVLRVEPVNGDGYSYLRCHVLAGVQVIAARLGDNYGPAPREGQDVAAECYVSAFSSRNGARLGVTMERPARITLHDGADNSSPSSAKSSA